MPYVKEPRQERSQRAPLRVLCAEDDEQMAFILKIGLQKAGHFVECVANGQAALERVLEDVAFFDLLITDHHMPQISGLRLVELLRERSFSGQIIVHSSQLQPPEVEAYRRLLVDHVFAKPLQTPDLLKVVRGLERHS